MPTSAEILTEAHRLAQVRLASANALQIRNLWRLLNLEDLDGTFDQWLTAMVPTVANGRAASARLAGNYYAAHRALALGVDAAPQAPILAAPLSADALAGTLLVTGPAAIKNALARGVQLDQAAQTAQGNSARAALYYVQAGGRETIVESTKADPKALGFARATSGDSCAFCTMLASRGPVYRSEDTAGFEAHPGCACEPEPTYSRNAPWPPGARQAQQVWRDATSGLARDDDPLNALRRHLAAQR